MLSLKKIVVFGFGYLGERFCGLLSGGRDTQSTWRSQPTPWAEVVAIVENCDTRARRAALLHPQAEIFESLEDLRRSPIFFQDFVVRDCGPLSARLELANFCEQVGKRCLLGKPLPPKLIEAAKPSEKLFGVDMSEVYNPVVSIIRKIVSSMDIRIDTICAVRTNTIEQKRGLSEQHRSGIQGGAFFDKMIHDLHLILEGKYTGTPGVMRGEILVNEVIPSCNSSEDAMSDVSFRVENFTGSCNVRLIGSWLGNSGDLAHRIGIGHRYIAESTLVYTEPGSAIPAQNLKLVTLSGVTSTGKKLQIIGNLQSRGSVQAGISVVCDRDENFRAVRFNVPIISSTKAFVDGFPIHLESVAETYNSAYRIVDRIDDHLKADRLLN